MLKSGVFIFFLLLSFRLSAVPNSVDGMFSGRISKIHDKTSLVRIRVDFANAKYLNKKDQLQFWDERDASKKCRGVIIGRSPKYLLAKISDINYCKRFVFLEHGAYIKIFSEDLVNNIKMGKEVMSVLRKKRLAMRGKVKNQKMNLNSHIEKVNAINKRFKVLRDKLEEEWKAEIFALEQDRTVYLYNLKSFESRLDEIDNKIQQYFVEDENMKTDRWALDQKLYFKK